MPETIGVNLNKKSGGALIMASAERELIMVVWGHSPQWGPGAEPLVRGSGAKPPEAESFLRSSHPKEGANWPHVHVSNEKLSRY